MPGAWIPGGAGGGGRRVTADGRDPLEGNCGGYASGAKGGTGKNGGQVDPKPPPEPSPAERGLKYSSVVPAPAYLELVQARLKSELLSAVRGCRRGCEAHLLQLCSVSRIQQFDSPAG